MDGKFFNQETKDLIVKVGEDLIVGSEISKNAVIATGIEILDGPAIRLFVNYIDRLADQKIPDEFDATINETIKMAIAGDYEEATEAVGTLLDSIVDIPVLDDQLEKLLFVDGLKFIVRLIQNWIEKKKTV
jgi:hypothetical protein